MNKLLPILLLINLIIFCACNSDNPTTKPEVDFTEEKAPPKETYQLPAYYADLEKKMTEHNYPYVHHIKNKGRTAEPTDWVVYHVVIKQNGVINTSTYRNKQPIKAFMPTKEAVGDAPNPTYEVLLEMAQGDSTEIIVRAGDFESLSGKLEADDIITYEISLLTLKTAAEVKRDMEATQARAISVKDSVQQIIKKYKAGKLKDQLVTTELGMQYLPLKKGTGKKGSKKTKSVVHYYGFLSDGTAVDNSFREPKPLSFIPSEGRMIKGWEEAVQLLQVGGNAVFFIPYTLAYGLAGQPPKYPEKTDLVFFMELISVD